MKITNNTQRTVVTHYQTVELEDGPIISAGDSYYEGTQFRVTKIKVNHLENKAPMTIRVSGPRVNSAGVEQYVGRGVMAHDLMIKTADLPDELIEVLDAAGIAF